MSDRDLATLGHLHKASVSNLGRTRDGGFRLAIDPPLSIDAARAAINKLRLNPAVLYVSIAERDALEQERGRREDGRRCGHASGARVHGEVQGSRHYGGSARRSCAS